MRDAATGKRLPLLLNTRTFASHLFFGPYIWLPIIAAFTWLGGLLALIILWARAGKPKYMAGEASVVFISDVGAQYKTLFIIICACTAGFFIASLFAERWLRHLDRLPVALRPREKVFDWLAIGFGIIGGAALILLSIFDAFHHSTIHWSMTLVFIVAVALSAIFQFAEVWSLHKDHPDRLSLLRSSIIKIIVIIIAVSCAIAFGVTYGYCNGSSGEQNGHSASICNSDTSASAALEWAVAFILVLFFLTLAADLWPAGKSSRRYMQSLAQWQEKHGEGDDFTGRRAFADHPERWREREEALREEQYERNHGMTQSQIGAGAGAGVAATHGHVGNGPSTIPGYGAQESAAPGYVATGPASHGHTGNRVAAPSYDGSGATRTGSSVPIWEQQPTSYAATTGPPGTGWANNTPRDSADSAAPILGSPAPAVTRYR